MITVTIYGLDEFVVGDLSAEMTANVAKLYEVDEDEVNFISTANMVFHKGVEQTSWNIIVHVNAPLKVQVMQNLVAQYILSTISEVAINVNVEFYYYSQDNRYTFINHEYPRYMSEENSINIESEACEGDECDDECHCHDDVEEGDDEDQIFTGDIFETFSKKAK